MNYVTGSPYYFNDPVLCKGDAMPAFAGIKVAVSTDGLQQGQTGAPTNRGEWNEK